MSWPTPAPGDISGRAAAVYEQLLPGIDARSANTVATANTRVTEMAMTDLYFYQADVAQELMPDTAVNNLPRIAASWGVPQVQASSAVGSVILSGVVNAVLPAQIPLTSASGQAYTTTQAATVGANGTVDVPVSAVQPGAAGNLVAGAPVTVTSPVGGLTSQTGTVDPNGLTGGADLQSVPAWRAAILAKIRNEPSGGDYQDYEEWALEALPNIALATCPPAACGNGVVSVVFLMDGFVPPTAAQIAAVQAYIEAKRPVTASATVYGGTLNPVNVSLAVSPNTPTIQGAALAALTLSFQQDAAIGATTYFSRLNNAVASSDGEYSHEWAAPTADVPAPSLFALNVLGNVVFT